jgi:protein-S-isoprenylcysteine O-methyltransferase Ste14
MGSSFVGHPAATALFAGTVGVWAGSEHLQALRQALRRRAEATGADRGSLVVVRLCGAAGVVPAALALTAPAPAVPDHAVVVGIGLGVVWAGIGLRWWCFRTLGRYFTFAVMTSPTQPVVTTGPYRVLRHPSSTGLLFVLGGIGLCAGNGLSLTAVLVLPLAGVLHRIHVEEAALSATLGAAYTTFAGHRKRLLPLVW